MLDPTTKWFHMNSERTDLVYLERKQRPFIMNVPLHIPSLGLEGLQVRADVRQVLVPAPGVYHQVDVVVSHLGHHGIVDGAAALVGEDGEGPGARAKAGDVSDDEGLEEWGAIAAAEAEAAHVGDVEEAGGGAAVEGGVHDRVLVLQRHAPPGERHHFAAVLDVEVVERRLLELHRLRSGGGGEGAGHGAGLGSGEAAGEALAELPEAASSHLGRRGGIGSDGEEGRDETREQSVGASFLRCRDIFAFLLDEHDGAQFWPNRNANIIRNWTKIKIYYISFLII